MVQFKTRPGATGADTSGSRPIKRFRRSKAAMQVMREAIIATLKNGQPMTVRQLFYALTVTSTIEKTEAQYKAVKRLTAKMRRDGSVPYSWLADATRWQRKPVTFSGPEEALRRTAETYRRALWDDALIRPEVWIEKDALAGVLVDVTAEWDVPLMVTRGYPSMSFLHSAATAIKARSEQGQRTCIYCLALGTSRRIGGKLKVGTGPLPLAGLRPLKFLQPLRHRHHLRWLEVLAASVLVALRYQQLHGGGEVVPDVDLDLIANLGDHDPSGLDIDSNIVKGIGESLESLEGFKAGGTYGVERTFADYADFARIAVTPEQIESMELPSRPTKTGDTRSKGFQGESVELDAIPPETLRDLARDAIERHVDQHGLDVLRKLEAEERAGLEAMASSFEGAI
jgi:hypothetical protein